MQENYINGCYAASDSSDYIELKNPATNQVSNKLHFASHQQLNTAVQSAVDAQKIWANTSARVRSECLMHWAALVKQHLRAFAELEVAQTGKPITEALAGDLPTCYGAIEYYAGLCQHVKGHYQSLETGICLTRPEPVGVVAAIGAWNYPLQIACWKVAPALAAGNAVVFKPSEYTPATALYLAELAIEAGLPKGLFNVVYGGQKMGQALCTHSGVNKISFTGSVPTGRAIIQASSEHIVPCTLELGGKSPLIIFDDVDLNEAVKLILMANFYTQGEVCSNASRVFVHQNIFDTLLPQLKQSVQELRVGLPMDPATQMGALITEQHLNNVLSKVEAAINQGAKCLTGGKRYTNAPLAKGNFMQPTVLTDCVDTMPIVQEELFGPVLTLLPFNDEHEVIQRANATPFGLAAGVATKDIKRAHRLVNQLHAGTVWVNHYNITPQGLPFGGVKQSGFGRENGVDTLQQYTRMKTVYIELEELGDF